MILKNKQQPVLFALEPHPMMHGLCEKLSGIQGSFSTRQFPDGESYLRIETAVEGEHCIVVANLSHPNEKYLPLIFLLETLREIGAASIGLIAPYLSYMRQDRRFVDGEAVTSRLFARMLSQHMDWIVTVDPHLHRYHSLDEIYTVPNRVVKGAPALAQWLQPQKNLVLVGPDAESEQWVSDIAQYSGHPFVIGQKHRYGDREVKVQLPDLSSYMAMTAVIIDDVISSGQTILQCINALKEQNIKQIKCAAVHGIFSDGIDEILLQSGLETLITSNTIPHASNAVDITGLLIAPVQECLTLLGSKS